MSCEVSLVSEDVSIREVDHSSPEAKKGLKNFHVLNLYLEECL